MHHRFTRRTFLTTTGVAAASLATTRFGLAADSKTLNVVLPLEPSMLQPAIDHADVTQTVAGGKIFQGLIDFGGDQKPRPELAESWDVSPDGLTYTFHLRKGVTWHDGKPFTSDDVAFSAGTMMPQVQPRTADVLKRIEKIETPDANTAILRLGAPFLPFMNAITGTGCPIAPRHIYENTEFRSNPANSKPIGTGPFKFAEWQKGQYIHLVRNPDYYIPDRPKVDEIYFNIIPDGAQRAIAMETGRMNVAVRVALGPNDINRLVGSGKFRPVAGSYRGLGSFFVLMINVRDERVLHDRRVRQAILFGLDRSVFVDVIYQGQGLVPDSVFMSGTAYYDPSAAMQYKHDPERAKALLDEAGLKPGADGVRASFNMIAAAVGEDRQRMFEVVRQQLSEIGLKVDVQATTDLASLFKQEADWNFDTYFGSRAQYGDPAIGAAKDYVTSNIHHQAGTNTRGYSNPEVDDLFAKAASALSDDEAQKYYSRLQTILSEDLPLLPLMEQKDELIIGVNVQGLDNQGPLTAYTSWDEVSIGA